MEGKAGGRARRVRGGLVRLLLLFVALTLVWWIVGRVTADGRRLEVRTLAAPTAARPDTAAHDGLRLLTWNLAHGRGDRGPGLLRNFRGGSDEQRAARLARIADVIRRVEPDVVVLNEVDFRSTWSGGVNQAEVLARAAGYATWVEQRNYDIRLPFAAFSFGNAVLTRLPVEDVRWLDIPAHSWIEALAAGAKSASVVRLKVAPGSLSLVPIHLEPRSGETRLAALPALEALRSTSEPPLILAGDFNTAPPGWPEADAPSVVGRLLERGWRSLRAMGLPGLDQLTYPTFDLREAIDWILVEPPLRVVEEKVLEGTGDLSDHAPVLAVVRWEEEP